MDCFIKKQKSNTIEINRMYVRELKKHLENKFEDGMIG